MTQPRAELGCVAPQRSVRAWPALPEESAQPLAEAPASCELGAADSDSDRTKAGEKSRDRVEKPAHCERAFL
eukprot:scaffold111698_cov33-Tisochrysis_lutea.AAC.2